MRDVYVGHRLSDYLAIQLLRVEARVICSHSSAIQKFSSVQPKAVFSNSSSLRAPMLASEPTPVLGLGTRKEQLGYGGRNIPSELFQ